MHIVSPGPRVLPQSNLRLFHPRIRVDEMRRDLQHTRTQMIELLTLSQITYIYIGSDNFLFLFLCKYKYIYKYICM